MNHNFNSEQFHNNNNSDILIGGGNASAGVAQSINLKAHGGGLRVARNLTAVTGGGSSE